MNLAHRSKYIISLLLLLWIIEATAQGNVSFLSRDGGTISSDSIRENKKRKPKRDLDFKYGIRLGIDLRKPFRHYTERNYDGIEFAGDFRLSRNIYIAAEYGREKKITDEKIYKFISSGDFFKIGMNYNLLKKRYYLENLIYVGFRYAQSSFNQKVYRYNVFSRNTYWEEKEIEGSNPLIKEVEQPSTYSWIELVLGFKAEIIANIYMGISARFSMNISGNDGNIFPPQWVPGFVKVVNNNKFSANFNYTISYNIPIINRNNLFKKRRAIKAKSKSLVKADGSPID